MKKSNAYRVQISGRYRGDLDEWWTATGNPFSHHGLFPLSDGMHLLMADPSQDNDRRLEAAAWCLSYCEVYVSSPQTGDTEPEGDHESVDGGEQLLWVEDCD